jgi:ferric-dicitrate binding protein FerR (iron transport regulator)
MRVSLILAPLTLALLCTAAQAGQWSATKLRGAVLVYAGGAWAPLKLGDAVDDTTTIQTLANGRVQLARDGETIDIGPDSQLQVHDRAAPHFTTVQAAFGTVTISDIPQPRPHFAVQTPFVAAVVKGTVFTVMSGKNGAQVRVREGEVAVEDRHSHTFVSLTANQHADISAGQPMTIGGQGALRPIIDARGRAIAPNAGVGSHGEHGHSNNGAGHSNNDGGKGGTNNGGGNGASSGGPGGGNGNGGPGGGNGGGHGKP